MTARHSLISSLHYPMFRRLLIALGVSQTGDWLYNVALLAVVYDRTHSSTWLAVTTAARVLPVVVFGPLGGLVADRFDRRAVLIISDIVRAFAMVALWIVASGQLPIVLVAFLAAVATTASVPYPPCVAATTPRLLPDAALAGGNAARSAIGAASIVLGPAIGGGLLVLTSPAAAFLVNAGTFVLSAVAVASIRGRDVFAPEGRGPSEASAGPLADLAAGIRALRGSARALRLIAADITCSVVYGAQTVLLVLVARQFGNGAHGYGWLLACTGAGGLVGTGLAGRAVNVRNLERLLAGALVAVAAPLALLAVAPALGVTLALVAVVGAGSMIVEVAADTGLQRCLDPAVLGRAYGFAFPAAISGIVVGSLVAGPLAGLLGLHAAFAVLGALVAGHAALLLRRSRRRPAVVGAPPPHPRESVPDASALASPAG